MDAALTKKRRIRHPLLVVALAPLIPHILGSAFNIWYNMVIIDPLLRTADLVPRFVSTVIVWNAVVYPITLGVWVWLIASLRPERSTRCSVAKRCPSGSSGLDAVSSICRGTEPLYPESHGCSAFPSF